MAIACRKSPSHLIVAFPLAALRQDQKILDPENTEFVAQYYLLENISRGIVKDSADSPDGYSPGIARTWTKLSSRRWALDIAPDLRWSDGSLMTTAQIAEHLVRLSKGRHRHIVYLKNLASAQVDGQRIIMSFKTPTNAGLIHELSLADTFLIHPRNLRHDWSIGSGPYVVENYSPGKKLTLRRNPFFPDSAEAAEVVELIGIPWEARPKMFENQKVDLYRSPGPHFARSNQPVITAAPKSYRGYPTCIYFFAFRPDYGPAKKVAVRRAIASTIKAAFSGIRLPELAPETQMVPKGFAGRLEHDVPLDFPTGFTARPEAIRIGLEPAFRLVPQVADALIRHFALKGVSVEISYLGDGNSDLNLCAFIGNQRDSLGSWRFLLSPERGDLRSALPAVRRLIDKAARTDDPRVRNELLLQIHESVLSDAHAVPVFIEPNIFLHSNRVNLSRISRFDMRLRFYDVRWQ